MDLFFQALVICLLSLGMMTVGVLAAFLVVTAFFGIKKLIASYRE